jgi:hypothetical protein
MRQVCRAYLLNLALYVGYFVALLCGAVLAPNVNAINVLVIELVFLSLFIGYELLR